jgi:hypothetical protein
MTAAEDAALPVRLRISSNMRCPRSGFVLAARACDRLIETPGYKGGRLATVVNNRHVRLPA